MIPMNTAVRDKWIAALTSGKYVQGANALSIGEAHCCLGVLCEVARDDGIIDEYDDEAPVPPDTVMVWADLQYPDAEACMAWNDDDRLTFAEIAARLA